MDLSLITFAFVLDMLPVGLACFALLRLTKVKKQSLITMLAKASSVLLLICQFTWIHSYLNGFNLVTSFMDSLWSVFNSVVMTLILLVTEREVHTNDCSNCYMGQTKETLQ